MADQRRLIRAASALSGASDIDLAGTAGALDALGRRMGEASAAAAQARQAALGAAEEARRLLADPYRLQRRTVDPYRLQRRTVDWVSAAGASELQGAVLTMLRRLRPQLAAGVEKIRLGSRNDGGYVMLDDFSGVSAALSFGVERNADWDVAIADRVGRVLQFDHTIDASPVSDPRVTWIKKKIAPHAGDTEESIVSIVDGLPASDRADLILKIDIEHDEWPLFDATPAEYLARFRQIAAELHGFDFIGDRQYFARMARVVEKISETHAVVHVHANNHCGAANIAGVMIPFILEITFAARSDYNLVPSQEVFPGPLDSPCDPTKADFVLGAFRF